MSHLSHLRRHPCKLIKCCVFKSTSLEGHHQKCVVYLRNPWFTLNYHLILQFTPSCSNALLVKRWNMVLTLPGVLHWQSQQKCSITSDVLLRAWHKGDVSLEKQWQQWQKSRSILCIDTARPYKPDRISTWLQIIPQGQCGGATYTHTDKHTQYLIPTLLNCGHSDVWCVSSVNYHINNSHCLSRLALESLQYE